MTQIGLYIHIPFCRSRCSYCDFATGLFQRDAAGRYVEAVVREIANWRELDTAGHVDTLYFGGGTPSLLSPAQIEKILTAVRERFRLRPDAEITMEMNPGSAGAPANSENGEATTNPVEILSKFRELGVNRVSFGAQTFNDRELARLGRSHDAEEIRQTFRNLREAGFQNVSFDLIAGLPAQTLEAWKRNLHEALALRPEHLSFYLLEVHEGTPLAQHIKRGMQPEPDDDLAAEMYELMLDHASAAGYEHYEISNLCLPGFESRHNTKYWTGQPYFGFGCSAHSYDGRQRRWSNERDVARYTELVEKNCSPVVERVDLTKDEARAEAVFLGLRMMKGFSTRNHQELFGADLREQHRMELARFREAGLIEFDGDLIRLTRSGALLSNEVFAAFI